MRQERSFMPSAEYAPVTQPRPDRPMTEIVSELVDNTERLVRQELELAVSEVSEKADRLKTDVTEAAIGGGVMYAGLLAIVAAAVLLLAKAVDPWLASLIVGVVVSVIGYAMMRKGTHDIEREDLKPRKTVRSVQRTAQSLKEATR